MGKTKSNLFSKWCADRWNLAKKCVEIFIGWLLWQLFGISLASIVAVVDVVVVIVFSFYIVNKTKTFFTKHADGLSSIIQSLANTNGTNELAHLKGVNSWSTDIEEGDFIASITTLILAEINKKDKANKIWNLIMKTGQ